MTGNNKAVSGGNLYTAEDASDFQLPGDDSADAAAVAGAFPAAEISNDRCFVGAEAADRSPAEPYRVRLLRLQLKTSFKRLVEELYVAIPVDRATVQMVEQQRLAMKLELISLGVS
jgi:hypothetical protein